MHAGNSTDPYVTVICPTCHTRLNPRRELLGKRVRCPDCGVAVRVVEGPAASVAAPVPTPSEYSLSESNRPVEQPKTFLVQCPTCGTRLFPRVDLVGKRVRCPDCKKPVLVPPPPIERAAKKIRSPGEYNVGVAIEPIKIPPSTYRAIAATVEDEPELTKERAKEKKQDKEDLPPPPPPEQWWLIGVFDFPWRENNVSRWMTLTIFAIFTTAVSLFLDGAITELASASGAASGVAVGLKILLSIVTGAVVWFLTMAYTSGVVVSIIRSTAAGNDEVADWSEAEIHDALWNSVVLWFPFVAAAGVAYGAFALVRAVAPPWEWWGAVATFSLVFPVMFFSVMEHGSALSLVSVDALRLIWGHFRGWLLLNIEVGLLVGAVAALTRFGLPYSRVLTSLFGGPIYAATAMIVARLIGRYFFRAHEVTEARRLKKEIEAGGGEEAEEDDDETESEREYDDDLDFGA